MSEFLNNNEIMDEPEFIQPPDGSYFIHGVRRWNKNSRISLPETHISCSLQKDGFTMPIRHFGYVLNVESGGIIQGFNRDVTSDSVEGEKILSQKTAEKGWHIYREQELSQLLTDTKRNSHNEIWIEGIKAEIVGAYVLAEEKPPGLNRFLKACRQKGLEVRFVKKPEISEQ